jgi:hypothetical protein
MFKKIRDIFDSKNTEEEMSTPRENEINQLIMAHKRRLAILEKQQASAGPDTPPMIVTEIEDIKRTIADLEAKPKKPDEPLDAKMPDNLKQLYNNAQEGLENFRTTLETTKNELDFVPEESQPGAIRLIDIGKGQLLEFEEEWNTLRQSWSVSEEMLRAFIKRIAIERESISILVQRGIHRRNLGILEKQLALRQSALTKDELETTLRPQMDFELEKITALEGKQRLDADEQERLTIHRNNLNIYQEMLSGQRPYAPLSLINQVARQEQAIQDIDNRLAR